MIFFPICLAHNSHDWSNSSWILVWRLAVIHLGTLRELTTSTWTLLLFPIMRWEFAAFAFGLGYRRYDPSSLATFPVSVGGMVGLWALKKAARRICEHVFSCLVVNSYEVRGRTKVLRRGSANREDDRKERIVKNMRLHLHFWHSLNHAIRDKKKIK